LRLRRLPVLLLLPLFSAAQSIPDPPAAALAAIRPAAIRAHMAFLADDLLEGRGTGTRGYDIAARYVQSQFEQLGLKPAGVNGGYLQPVPYRTLTLVPDECYAKVLRDGRETALTLGSDYVMRGSEVYPETSVEAPAVFVGFGVTAPSLRYDDYAGADVKGKMVVVLYGAPPTFPASERAHFSSTWVKNANAVAHGATGIVTIWTETVDKLYPFAKLSRDARAPSMRWLGPDGVPNDAQPQLRGAAALSTAAGAALFQGAARSYAEAWAAAQAGKPQQFPLPVSIALKVVGRHGEVASPNVVGVLEGSDPQLKDQYIIYSAHLDHLGIGEPVNGDAIYNGALDNASGVAAILEIARAFRALPQPPRRSVIFLAVSGEEKGLLGAGYFANHPTVPAESIAADVNIDEIFMLYDFADIVARGAEHSSIGAVVEHAAAAMALRVSPDPQPEEVVFVRSDQYAFIRRGVPALFADVGFHSSDPKIDGAKLFAEWEAKRYHQPSDDMQQPLDLAAAAKFARFNLRVGYALAQMPARPQWNKGDFFGETFAKK